MAREETILSLHKAIDILVALQQGGEMGVTEISKLLTMNKSTVHRILSTLQSRDLVRQNPETGRYWLGLKLYSLGMAVKDNLPIKSIAEPYLKELSEQLNEVVHLSVLDFSSRKVPKLMIVDKVQTGQILSFSPSLGSGTPCYCSAMGKCLLAFAEQEYIERFINEPLHPYTINTIVSWPELLVELEKIREKKYAIEDQEMEVGLTCVGAPILDRKQKTIAAFSVSGPTSRINLQLPNIIEAVKKTAQEVCLLID